MFKRCCIGVCGLMLAACSSGEPNVAPQPINAFSWKNRPVEFIGVVTQRYPSPGQWSGDQAAFQAVRYNVKQKLTGPILHDQIVVYHSLVPSDLTEANPPQLSRDIFAVGNTLRIMAQRTENGQYVAWENPDAVEVLDRAKVKG